MQNQLTLQQAIAEDLKLGHLSKGAQEKVLTGLTENILKSVVLKILTTLSPEDQAEVDRISNDGDIELLLEFLAGKVPNFDEFVAEETRAVVARFNELRAEV